MTDPTYDQLMARYQGTKSALKLAADDLQVSDDWPENLDHRDVLGKYIVDPTVRKLDRFEAALAIIADESHWDHGEWQGPGYEARDIARLALGTPMIWPDARGQIEAAIEAWRPDSQERANER